MKYNWPGIAWLVLILILMGIPGDAIPEIVLFRDWLKPDKLVHLVLFGILTVLFIYGYRRQSRLKWLRGNAAFFAIIIGIIFGFLTELFQYFVFVGRNGNIFDFLANVAGCLLGWILYLIFLQKKFTSIIKNS